MLSPTENSWIQGLFKAFEWFSSTFQSRFNFQGLFKPSKFNYFSSLCEHCPCNEGQAKSSDPFQHQEVGDKMKLDNSPGILKFSLIPVGKSVFSGTVFEKFSSSGNFVGISIFLGTSTGGRAEKRQKDGQVNSFPRFFGVCWFYSCTIPLITVD